MKILTLNDEAVLKEIDYAIKEADKKAEIHDFTKSDEALAFLKDNKVDAAFIGYRAEGRTSQQLFDMFDAVQPNINIIFITGYNGGSVSRTLDQKVSGVMGRPFMGNDARRELDNLRYPVSESMHGLFVGSC